MRIFRAYCVAICLSAIFLFVGCTGGLEKFPLVDVSGTVTCEGKPVPNAIVFFEPLRSGESATTGKQGFATTDSEGRFVVSTYGENDGAVVGKHIIRVGKTETSPPCDCALNANVELKQVEISGDEPIELAFELPKKSRRQRDEVLEDDDE